MRQQFWQNKRVFVTGHTGFKGSWLSLWLHTLGAEVTGYALPPNTQPNIFDLTCLPSHLTSILADIRDLDPLKQAIIHAKPDIIFHLAAQPLVRHSYEYPIETYQTNVLGTVHLLEAMRFSETAKILINITTDKCYENKEWHWGYREMDPLGGYDPYSSSKGCAELVTAAYRNSYFNPKQWEKHGKSIASARAGNVIGGGDWSKDRLIPDMVTALTEGRSPFIRFPHATRPWQHVLEPLSGYLTLAEKMWHAPSDYAEAWNFGPTDKDCQPVSQVADQFCQAWGEGAAWQPSLEDHPHEAAFLKLDISKALSCLKWQPQWTLREAIETTVAWYKSWIRGEDVLALTLQQLKDYTAAGGQGSL